MKATSEHQKSKIRLGTTPSDHLAWILRFIDMKLKELSAGQLSDLGWEYKTLENLNPLGFLFGGVKSADSSKKSPLLLGEEYGEQVNEEPPGLEEMDKVQKQLKIHVHEFLYNHQTKKEFIHLKLGVKSLIPYFKNDPKAAFHYPCELTISADVESQWSMKLLFLLGYLGHEISECRECRTIFHVERKDQVFCKRRCLNRYAQRLHQEKKRQGNKKVRVTKKPGSFNIPHRKGKK